MAVFSSSSSVLYANSQFQVCLRTLHPLSETTVPEASQATGYRAWPLTGQLHFQDAKGAASQTLQSGQNFGDGVDTAPVTVKNPSATEEASWLEVVFGEFSPLAPQGETETRPWGSYTVLRDEPTYKLKQLAVQPGNRLSLQRHQKREEHWMVVAGGPEVTLDQQTLRPVAGESVTIPLKSWHRISNTDGKDLVEIIEIQLGTYFGEDDIERSEDDYGRAAQ